LIVRDRLFLVQVVVVQVESLALRVQVKLDALGVELVDMQMVVGVLEPPPLFVLVLLQQVQRDHKAQPL
jgi:hypothetical protein